MSDYIATFHTHLSAMRSQRALEREGISARLSPVPRALSASCGTCVRYRADNPCSALLDRDWERIVCCVPASDRYEPAEEND